jgi:hypothetical protein
MICVMQMKMMMDTTKMNAILNVLAEMMMGFTASES